MFCGELSEHNNFDKLGSWQWVEMFFVTDHRAGYIKHGHRERLGMDFRLENPYVL